MVETVADLTQMSKVSNSGILFFLRQRDVHGYIVNIAICADISVVYSVVYKGQSTIATRHGMY